MLQKKIDCRCAETNKQIKFFAGILALKKADHFGFILFIGDSGVVLKLIIKLDTI